MTIVTFGQYSFDTEALRGRGFLTPYVINGVTYELETAMRVAAALDMAAKVATATGAADAAAVDRDAIHSDRLASDAAATTASGARTAAAQSAATAAAIARPLHPAVVAACAPIIDMDFRSPDAVPAGVVRGASGKWVCGPTGSLSLVPAGTPPIDHDPATGSVRGLLIEGAATNLASAGEDVASWARGDVVVTSGAATSPLGRAIAKVAAGTSNTTHYVQAPSVSGLTAGGVRIASFWAKAEERGRVQIDVLTPAYGDYVQVAFDLRNGVTTLVSKSAGATLIGMGAIYHPGGWWRLWVAALLPGTVALTNAFLLSDIGAQTYAGDGVSGLYLGGYELAGVGTAPSSPIPASIPTTRAADLDDLALSSVPGWNSTEWTICAELLVPSLTPGVQRHAVTLHAGPQNYIRVGWMDGTSSGASLGMLASASGTIVALQKASVLTAGASIRIACSLDAAGRLAQSVNGAAPLAATLSSRPTVTALALGARDAGIEPLNGWLRRVTVFPRSRPDETLQLLSGV